jgi:hypothetical protein
MASQIKVEKISVPAGSDVNFGATVSNIDIENLTGKNIFACKNHSLNVVKP